MSTPHKHSALIHALADGMAVEYRLIGGAAWDAVRDFSLFDETGYEFRLKPHRWQAEIDAQKAGKIVQWRITGASFWGDSIGKLNFDAPLAEFRIKPEMIRFRMYLLGGAIITAEVLHSEHFAAKAEANASFIRWLGDWQEVEA